MTPPPRCKRNLRGLPRGYVSSIRGKNSAATIPGLVRAGFGETLGLLLLLIFPCEDAPGEERGPIPVGKIGQQGWVFYVRGDPWIDTVSPPFTERHPYGVTPRKR